MLVLEKATPQKAKPQKGHNPKKLHPKNASIMKRQLLFISLFINRCRPCVTNYLV